MLDVKPVRKALQYLLVNPDFEIDKIRTGVLRFIEYEKPRLFQDGMTVYGRLEMFELLPEDYRRSFIYVGWRDFTKADQTLFDKIKRYENYGG